MDALNPTLDKEYERYIYQFTSDAYGGNPPILNQENYPELSKKVQENPLYLIHHFNDLFMECNAFKRM